MKFIIGAISFTIAFVLVVKEYKKTKPLKEKRNNLDPLDIHCKNEIKKQLSKIYFRISWIILLWLLISTVIIIALNYYKIYLLIHPN